MTKKILIYLVIFVPFAAGFGAMSRDWLQNVPEQERQRSNPLHSQTEAVSAGEILYADHCAACHGKNADGRGKRPSLHTPRVQQEASEGDLHWLLVNGNMRKGMPSWAKLPDPQLWQIVSYLKTLKPAR